MNTYNNEQGGFFMAIADNNRNQVLIFNGLRGCLKVLGNSEKYFRAYWPEFYEFDLKGKKYKITRRELKESFIRILKNDPKAFNTHELEALSLYLKVKIENYLSESKTCQVVKGSMRKNSNKYVKPYARKRK